jgi:hypothetical protein
VQAALTSKASEAVAYVVMIAFLLRTAQVYVQGSMGDVPKVCAVLIAVWLILSFIVRQKFGRGAWWLLVIFPERDLVGLALLILACATGANCL